MHAHKELVGDGVTELLEVENVVLVGGEDARDGVDDARLVGAPECEDVVIGHVECLALRGVEVEGGLGIEVVWLEGRNGKGRERERERFWKRKIKKFGPGSEVDEGNDSSNFGGEGASF